MKFANGQRVYISSPTHKRAGQEGVVSGYDWSEDYTQPEVEVHLESGRFVYLEEDELDLVVDYEYAYQLTFGDVVRKIEEKDWTTHREARKRYLLRQAAESGGDWTAKVVKRRKAGPIEDA